MKKLLLALLGASLIAAAGAAGAAPVLGTTAVNADLSADFDDITLWQNLTSYSQNGIVVTLSELDQAYLGFTPFAPAGDFRLSGYHYAAGGNNGYLRIVGAQDELFSGADFLLGNGWESGSSALRWATYLDGTLTGTGSSWVATGLVSLRDTDGFDELRLAAGLMDEQQFGDFQAIALDDLHLQFLEPVATQPANPVPEPGTVALLGLALAGLAAARRR